MVKISEMQTPRNSRESSLVTEVWRIPNTNDTFDWHLNSHGAPAVQNTTSPSPPLSHITTLNSATTATTCIDLSSFNKFPAKRTRAKILWAALLAWILVATVLAILYLNESTVRMELQEKFEKGQEMLTKITKFFST